MLRSPNRILYRRIVANAVCSSPTSRTPRSSSPVPRWPSVVSRRARRGTTSSRMCHPERSEMANCRALTIVPSQLPQGEHRLNHLTVMNLSRTRLPNIARLSALETGGESATRQSGTVTLPRPCLPAIDLWRCCVGTIQIQ